MTTNASLALTPSARTAASRDLAPGEWLRIAFVGGCGALGYRLSRVRRTYDGDVSVEIEDIPILLDARAARELVGVTLDHADDEGFLLQHPSWGASC